MRQTELSFILYIRPLHFFRVNRLFTWRQRLFEITLNIDHSNSFMVRIAKGDGSCVNHYYNKLEWKRQWYAVVLTMVKVDTSAHKKKYEIGMYRNAKKLEYVRSYTQGTYRSSAIYLLLGHADVRGGASKYNYIGQWAVFRVLPYALNTEDVAKIKGIKPSLHRESRDTPRGSRSHCEA
jgi:hypothetical protein